MVCVKLLISALAYSAVSTASVLRVANPLSNELGDLITASRGLITALVAYKQGDTLALLTINGANQEAGEAATKAITAAQGAKPFSATDSADALRQLQQIGANNIEGLQAFKSKITDFDTDGFKELVCDGLKQVAVKRKTFLEAVDVLLQPTDQVILAEGIAKVDEVHAETEEAFCN